MFIRPDEDGASNYYKAITVTVLSNGTYKFSSSSAMNIYCILYEYTFDPLFPKRNIITKAYNTSGTGQYIINTVMQSTLTYVLVVTTSNNNETGNFLITVNGPSQSNLTLFRPTASKYNLNVSSIEMEIWCIIIRQYP